SEVGVSAAAVLLGYRHTQEALFSGLQPHPAVNDLGLLPLVVVRRDVAVEEGPAGLAEQIVFRFEKGALVLDGSAHGFTFGQECLLPNIYQPGGWSAAGRASLWRRAAKRRTPAGWPPAPPERGPGSGYLRGCARPAARGRRRVRGTPGRHGDRGSPRRRWCRWGRRARPSVAVVHRCRRRCGRRRTSPRTVRGAAWPASSRRRRRSC